MKNKDLFGALRVTTLAALCAGGLVLATAGCSAEPRSDAGSGGDDGAAPAKIDGEKSCGEKSCGADDAAEKAGGEKSCGEKSCGEKSCGEKSCG